MNLKEILYKVNITKVVGITNVEVSNIAFDSRKIKFSSLFVAIQGTVFDGHDYIDSTIEKGAVAIVVENIPKILNEKVTYIKVEDSNTALGIIAIFHFNIGNFLI